MSRFLRKPIRLPAKVEISCNGREVVANGERGRLTAQLPCDVQVDVGDAEVWLRTEKDSTSSSAMAGTAYAMLRNLVEGVSRGFERRLEIVGVGYRAQASGRKLNLALGFSHPVDMEIPAGLEVETPSPTEIIIRGSNRQAVGSLAARIRSLRKPEPYKGKGVKYAEEIVRRKEAKKKA